MAAEPSQLTLSLIAESVGAKGVDELPGGVGELSGRELAFVQGLLAGKSQVEAALAAPGGGEQTRDQAMSWASKSLRKPHVVAFYGRCIERVAANAGAVAQRLTEMSLQLHRIATEQLERWREAELAVAEEVLAQEAKRKAGISISDTERTILAVRERQRDVAFRQAGFAVKEAKDHNETLAAMLGKLRLTVDGEVRHVAVAQQALSYLAEARMEGLRAGGGN